MGNQQTFEEFDRFEDLPKPALQEILLKLKREQLHAICSISRKAFSICQQPNFQDMYNQLHGGQMFYGNLHITSKATILTNVVLSLEDDIETRIGLSYSEDKILIGSTYYNRSNDIIIEGNRIRWYTSSRTKDDLLIRLREIGKEKWIDKFSKINDGPFEGFFIFNKEIAYEIWNIVQREVAKVYPEIKNVQLSEKSSLLRTH